MSFLSSTIFGKTPNPQTHTPVKPVTGTPAEISKSIYNDILFMKSEISQYNEITGILDHNSLYSKIYKMMCEAHKKEVDAVKVKHKCNTSASNHPYYRDLNCLYKKIIGELEDFTHILHNNYNKGIYDSHISKSRSQSPVPSIRRRSLDTTLSSESQLSGEHLKKLEDEAPDNLIDPISFQLFSDPVVAPSGITYERSHLVDHLNKKGPFDPLTRENLRVDQLHPNLAVKDSVANYIRQSTEV